MKRLLGWLMAAGSQAALAAGDAPPAPIDSYRFMHVTIDTPWHIFLFLLIGIFAPFVLMVVLVWRNSWRKSNQQQARGAAPESHDR